MNSLSHLLTDLAQSQNPAKGAKERIWKRVNTHVTPVVLLDSVEKINPSTAFQQRVRRKVLARAWLPDRLKSLAGAWSLPSMRAALLKESIVARLRPRAFSLSGFGIKWTAAFAVFLLAIRMMPLVLLAPVTQAETSVQLIPSGEVWVSIGGVSNLVETPQVLTGPAVISTGPHAQATIILNDDGVLRLSSNTTVRLYDLGDRPQFAIAGATATLVSGQLWALGLLPPTFQGLSIETRLGSMEVNAGSVSLTDDGSTVTTAVYDRGASFSTVDNKNLFLVSGERAIARQSGPLYVNDMPPVLFTTPWASVNLDQDAVHRTEIAALQQVRREKMAGILPTSFLYPAKRIAEEVDVLFTLGNDAKTEKRVQQADTRLSEAITLIDNGENDEALESLTEYRETLVALASGTGDNLVQFLVRKQIDELSSSITVASADNQLVALQQAVLDVSAAIPNVNLKPKDIEGYVLVDKLTALNTSLTTSRNLTGALVAYAEIQPYLATLLSTDSDVHPLLQREARSLLVTTASLLASVEIQEGANTANDIEADIAIYLPAEQERVLLGEAELNAQVDAMVQRIFTLKLSRSRYNQLMNEMSDIRSSPYRGTLLRRLYRVLPENGLAGYVRTEIKLLGDELGETAVQ